MGERELVLSAVALLLKLNQFVVVFGNRTIQLIAGGVHWAPWSASVFFQLSRNLLLLLRELSLYTLPASVFRRPFSSDCRSDRCSGRARVRAPAA